MNTSDIEKIRQLAQKKFDGAMKLLRLSECEELSSSQRVELEIRYGELVGIVSVLDELGERDVSREVGGLICEMDSFQTKLILAA